jgi:hypothetical protein
MSRTDRVEENLYAVNEGTAHTKIISCTNVTKIKPTGKYLFKTKWKWKSNVGGTQPPPPLKLAGSRSVKCENGLKIEIVMVQ